MEPSKKLRDIVATIYSTKELATFKELCAQYWIVGKKCVPPLVGYTINLMDSLENNYVSPN